MLVEAGEHQVVWAAQVEGHVVGSFGIAAIR